MDAILSRVISRKFAFGVAGLVFFILGASDTVTVTTTEEFLSGATAVASLIGITLEDLVKRANGN